MLSTIRPVRRLLVGTALLVVAGLAPLQAATPSEGAATDLAPAAVGSSDCAAVRLESDATPWTCTFVDNFDGTSLDDAKWIIQRTSQTGFRTGRTCYTDSPDNVAVRDGNLVLTAHKGRWVKCTVGLRWLRTRFTGGMIGTRGKFSQTYGRFEVRARFSATATGGVHGGFWMFPVDHTYGRWPASGEIDVAEWWSYEPTLVLPSLHFNGRDPDVDSGWDCRVNDVTQFHTYTAVWQPSVIKFYIDGKMCFTRTWTPDSPQLRPQPFDHGFSMILNLGVLTQGLSWRTKFPAELVVDYARAWQ